MTIDSSLKVGSNEMELVDFRIFKQENDEVYEGIYGVNVSKVREIIKLPKLTELPGTPKFIEGIFDLRNIVIPVVNLAKWMGIEEPVGIAKNSRVVITEFNNVLIGFIVHEAKRIRRINWSDIEPASFMRDSASVEGSKITGVTKIEGDNVLLILDLESVVQDLGLYEPDTQNVPNQIESFSGMALVLDDSSTARKIVKEALIKMGFNVLEAIDGEEGLTKLDELYELYGKDLAKNLKIIISDVEMPRMDGFHFAANVKEDGRFSNIPIVFNSSISDHFSELRGVEAGGEAYLVKFQASLFYNEVARVVRAHMK
ncbi:MAG: fused signal transduction protein/response regulator [Sulfurimonas sp. RIFOXYD12_FULL_33_39]|uniref:chemotaxis protein n=1 Tax=unclassified Sulfurimonas TaxID=2623549 RepID=UPI0008B15CD8|nr:MULTISPECIES: chemotaxis protein [unclassified Sulfurimonas]OHE01100.1 MAG: fused signal transduction protein/response regulator [Sulfurimonas sp. RIFCSPLOWO2_12_FULL_34_6]OHE10243.1 MAG: fused signal transduction protein/response regulator [Sulfurimonas sp. RIFOXYD12_FULL_33_39]OHE14536.1 MAG: fused signal transduction protein/response regulator [Sulfurimonas sp. RIFOXYD2_FULL_34_21]DAB27914.1 MAG TPA: fused signal transduction protein/response regulator [Sulfurimonas sp. UBA10385]